MFLFKKKKPQLSESAELVKRRDGRYIQYMTMRAKDKYNETVIAREGVLNIVGDELVISCENREILRAPLSDIKAYELMNLSGINIIYGGNTYIAYYTKGIENK